LPDSGSGVGILRICSDECVAELHHHVAAFEGAETVWSDEPFGYDHVKRPELGASRRAIAFAHSSEFMDSGDKSIGQRIWRNWSLFIRVFLVDSRRFARAAPFVDPVRETRQRMEGSLPPARG
jgi:hypothetical protein